jgi:replicative DNA helicase
MQDGEQLAGIRDWGSKLPGAALRLAAIFQATISVEAITVQMMAAALAFAGVLESHALAVFGLIANDPTIERADKTLLWLINRGAPNIDGRDVFNALQSSMKSMDNFREAIQLLEDYGYVRITSRQGARGRHAMEIEVNPKLWEVEDAGNVA